MIAEPTPAGSIPDPDNLSLHSVIVLIDMFVKRLIKLCKRLAAFKQLSQEDQVALLKGLAVMEMILTMMTRTMAMLVLMMKMMRTTKAHDELLAGCVHESIIIRNVGLYDESSDSWRQPGEHRDHIISVGVLKIAKGTVYEDHTR